MPTIIEVVQRKVVGAIEISIHGELDMLDEFAKIAMTAARDDMHTDEHSASTFEIEHPDSGATIALRIDHTPKVEPELTVEEAKRALNDARRRQQERDEPQPA